MSAGHDHSDLATPAHIRPLGISFGLVAGFALVELGFGLVTGSLALTADAGHMFVDALGLGMALAAAALAGKVRPDTHRTFGLFRVEIVAALANAVLLMGLGAYVIIEAVRRFGSEAEVDAPVMVVVGFVGLVVNVIAFALLRKAAGESLNVEGAFLEVVGDLLASVGVVVAGLVIIATGWSGLDSLVGVAIGMFILPRALRLGRKAVHVLMEAAPDDVPVADVGTALEGLPEVIEVHDLHVWTLTSSVHAATAHLVIDDGVDSHPTLDAARSLLVDRFGIEHATFQIEPLSHSGCDRLSW